MWMDFGDSFESFLLCMFIMVDPWIAEITADTDGTSMSDLNNIGFGFIFD